MAYKERSNWNEGHPLQNGYFNIDMAVGGGERGSGVDATNRPTDMQLVFYFLWKIYRDGDSLMFPKRPGDNFAKTPEKIDYNSKKIQKKLTNIIYRFQTDLLNANKLVYRNGRCEKGGGHFSRIYQTRHTIHHLNYHYAGIIREKCHQDNWQTYLLTDPFFPEKARQEILLREISALGVAV